MAGTFQGNRKYLTESGAEVDGILVAQGFEPYKARAGLEFTATFSKVGGAATTVTVMITAPTTATAVYSLRAQLSCDNGGTFSFRESPSATATGATAMVNYCTDRTSSNVATSLTVISTPTVTTTGTALETHIISSVATTGTAINIKSVETKKYRLGSGLVYLAHFVPVADATTGAINLTIYRES